MTIIRENPRNYVTFNDIKVGSVFEFRGLRILMKMTTGEDYNAVDLENGEQYWVSENEPVIALRAIVTIQD